MEIGDANRMQEYDARVLDHRRSYDANARLTRLTECTNRLDSSEPMHEKFCLEIPRDVLRQAHSSARRVSNSDPSNWRKLMEIG